MNAVDLVLQLWIEGGCHGYSNGWKALTMYPTVYKGSAMVCVRITCTSHCTMSVYDNVVKVVSRDTSGFGRSFDLLDPNSINELELFIKDTLNNNTSSPA